MTSRRGLLHRILATNRDEILDRPTEHARFRHSFKDHAETVGHAEPDILCGLDLQAGGTWLGLNKTSGCVTFLYVDSPFTPVRECSPVVILFENRTNISEPLGTYELSRGYLVSSLLLPSLPENSVEKEIQNLLNLESRFAGFNLLVFVPRAPEPGSEGSWRLSYEVTKLSNNGGGNPMVSRTLTGEERKGGAMSNGIDGNGGDEWPKVQDITQSLREIIKDDLERTDDPSLHRRSDEELAEELFGILSSSVESLRLVIVTDLLSIVVITKIPLPDSNYETPLKLYLLHCHFKTSGPQRTQFKPCTNRGLKSPMARHFQPSSSSNEMGKFSLSRGIFGVTIRAVYPRSQPTARRIGCSISSFPSSPLHHNLNFRRGGSMTRRDNHCSVFA